MEREKEWPGCGTGLSGDRTKGPRAGPGAAQSLGTKQTSLVQEKRPLSRARTPPQVTSRVHISPTPPSRPSVCLTPTPTRAQAWGQT